MHERLVKLFVDRCGAAPLEITLSPQLDIRDFSFLKELAPLSANIRKMRFPNLSLRHMVEFSSKFNEPLQMLREVEIKDSCGDYWKEEDLLEWPFLAGATNLVSFNLLCNGWEPGTLRFVIRFPTLTHLKIQFDPGLRSTSTNVHELLELFRNLPQLEDIHIDARVVPDAAEECSNSFDKFGLVHLPRLHNIHLSWTTYPSQYTLHAYIAYPHTCSVSLRAFVPLSSKHPFPKSWRAFFLPNLSSVTLRMKRNRDSTECAVIVKKPGGASISVSSFRCLFDLDSDRDRDDDLTFSAAISWIRELPLHWIKVFVLEDLRASHMLDPKSFKIPPGLIKLIRSELSHLKTLTLTRTRVPELLESSLRPLPLPLALPTPLREEVHPNRTHCHAAPSRSSKCDTPNGNPKNTGLRP